MKKFKIFFLIALSFTFACSNGNFENSSSDNTSKTDSSYYSRVSDSCLFQSSNPYNYVGDIHNQLVESYMELYSDENYAVQDIVDKIEDIASSNSDFLSIKPNDYVPVDVNIIDDGIDDFDNRFHTIIGNLEIGNMAKNKLILLVDYMFSEAESSLEPAYSDVQSFIIDLENDVMNDSSFNSSERRILLSACATARYSCCFWYNYYSKAKSNNLNSAQKRSWWQWVIVGVSDVGGAIAGATVSPAVAVTTGAAASTAAFNMTDPDKK